MKRIIQSLLISSVVLMSAGCTSTISKRADGMQADARIGRGKTLVILKADIELFELQASGMAEPRADWTDAATANVNTAIASELAERGVKVVQAAQTNPDQESAPDPRVRQLELLSTTVGNAILQHEIFPYGRLPHRARTFDWRIGPGASLLQSRYQADYALATVVRDSYSTGGRKAVMVVGMVLGFSAPLGSQKAYTTLVDLNTGKVIWVNYLNSEDGDLRELAAARKAIKSLLSGMPL